MVWNEFLEQVIKQLPNYDNCFFVYNKYICIKC